MKGQRLLVLCSFSEKAQILPNPTGFDFSKAKLILNNYSDNELELNVLKPYETRVYLWE